MARRGVDPHARDARRRWATSARVWVADSFAGLPRGDAPDDGSLDLRDFDFLAVPAGGGPRQLRAAGLEDGVRFVPGLLRAERCRRWPSRRWAHRPAGRRHLRGDPRWRCDCLYPGLSRRRLPDRRRLRLRSRAAGARSTSSAPSSGSPSRSRRSTRRACAGGARAPAPIAGCAPARAAAARARRAAARRRGRRAARAHRARARAGARGRPPCASSWPRAEAQIGAARLAAAPARTRSAPR